MDFRVGERRVYRFDKARQPVDRRNKDIAHATVLKTVENRQPVFGRLACADPYTKYIFMTFKICFRLSHMPPF